MLLMAAVIHRQERIGNGDREGARQQERKQDYAHDEHGWASLRVRDNANRRPIHRDDEPLQLLSRGAQDHE
jgi:hypothetical protein